MVSTYNISHKEEMIIQALLETKSIKEACKHANIGEATMYRYLKKDSFQQKLSDSRQKIISSLVNRLQSASHIALEELLRIIGDEYARENTKVQACRAILDTTIRSTEIQKLEHIEMRLSELENGVLRRAR